MIHFEVSLTTMKFVITTCAVCIKTMIINEKYESAEVFFRIISPFYFLSINSFIFSYSLT